jgi:hypothetical protein
MVPSPIGLVRLQDTAQQFAWVALPQWKALSLSRHPVALPVPDCAANADIVAACKAKVSCWHRGVCQPVTAACLCTVHITPVSHCRQAAPLCAVPLLACMAVCQGPDMLGVLRWAHCQRLH